jgi:hypothetical protein
VIVEKAGFTADTTTFSGTYVSYGLILINSSTTTDALNVGVKVSLTDTLGRSVATDTQTITAIPAAQRFYFSGRIVSNVSLVVASMKVELSVGANRAKSLTLPTASNIAFSTDEFGFTRLTGQLTNPYKFALPDVTKIYAVLFDNHGSVVGGGSEPTLAQIQPGATVSFDLSDHLFPFEGAGSAQISVDPCGGFEFNCPLVASS